MFVSAMVTFHGRRQTKIFDFTIISKQAGVLQRKVAQEVYDGFLIRF